MDTSTDEKAKDAPPPKEKETPKAADGKDKKAAEEKKTEEPKKKVKREDLKVTIHFASGMDQKALTAAVEREAQIASQDQAIAETNAERNALESYCLEMRGKVEDELSEFVAPAVKEKFLQDCMETEEWLYDAGQDAQRSEVKAKLTALKTVGEAAKKREFEFSHREETLLQLKTAITRWEKLAATEEEKYAHIDAAERKKVTEACAAADQQLAQDQQKQSKLGKHDDPIITVANLHAKTDALNKTCSSIMNKAKPKPEPKPEEKKPEPAAAAGAAPEAGADKQPSVSPKAQPGAAETPKPQPSGAQAPDSTQKPDSGMDMD